MVAEIVIKKYLDVCAGFIRDRMKPIPDAIAIVEKSDMVTSPVTRMHRADIFKDCTSAGAFIKVHPQMDDPGVIIMSMDLADLEDPIGAAKEALENGRVESVLKVRYASIMDRKTWVQSIPINAVHGESGSPEIEIGERSPVSIDNGKFNELIMNGYDDGERISAKIEKEEKEAEKRNKEVLGKLGDLLKRASTGEQECDGNCDTCPMKDIEEQLLGRVQRDDSDPEDPCNKAENP